MYKIYINETPLFLVNTSDLAAIPSFEGEILKARYPGKPKFLLHYIDMLEKSQRFTAVILYAPQAKQIYRDIKTLLMLERAAGGMVYNEAEEILLIFRRGSWDLPKGKIDPGEGKKAAAIREVQEETGIRQITLGPKIGITYHTFRNRSGKRVLKKTFWYLMKTTEEELTPQAEEDIERAEWMSLSTFYSEKRVVYKNILDVLEKGTILSAKMR